MKRKIVAENISTNNLSIDKIEIPLGKLVVITGSSGSGKTSLIYNTIANEAKNILKYGVYHNILVADINSPKLTKISGLSPVITLEQRFNKIQAKMTFSQVSGLHTLLSVLFINFAIPYCPIHKTSLKSYSINEIINRFMSWPDLPENIRLKRSAFYRYNFTIPIPIHGIDDLYQHNKQNIANLIINLRQLRLDQAIISTIDKNNNTEHHFIEEDDIDEFKIDKKITAINIISYSISADRSSDSFSATINNKLNEIFVKLDNNQLNKNISIWNPINQTFENFNCSNGCSFDNCDITINSSNINNYNHIYSMHKCKTCNGYGIIENNTCPSCKGSRLDEIMNNIKLFNTDLIAFNNFTVDDFIIWLENNIKTQKEEIAIPLLKDLLTKAKLIKEVGLGYLTLGREASTLSGGEIQRTKLITRLNSSLNGIIYIFDEPSIGLHPSEINILIDKINDLIKAGNSVLVIEHDKDFMLAADHLIVLDKGKVICEGSIKEIISSDIPLAKYLSNKVEVVIDKKKFDKAIEITNISKNNLKNISCNYQINAINVITGPSGCGKTTLINTSYVVLSKLLSKRKISDKDKSKLLEEQFIGNICNYQHINNIFYAKQNVNSNNKRLIDYMELNYLIAEIFADENHGNIIRMKSHIQLTEGHFRLNSNIKTNRCQECNGTGINQLEIDDDTKLSLVCNVCQGKKFSPQVLSSLLENPSYLKGKNIADIYSMRVKDAYKFFDSYYHYRGNNKVKKVQEILKQLIKVNLGHLILDTTTNNISGGEFQRLYLAEILFKANKVGNSIIILDEPTTGLHFSDVQSLMNVIQELRDLGNTIIIIEHNIEVIKNADYIVELGPKSGKEGGELIFTGTVKQLLKLPKNKQTLTGKYLQ